MVIPVQIGSDLDTGVAIVNVVDNPIYVRLSLFNEEGMEVDSIVPMELASMDSGNHVAKFVTELFSGTLDLDSFRGKLVIEVIGDGKLSATGLVQKEGVLSGLPVIVIR